MAVKQATMSGAELVGRVVALEGFVMVLLEAQLDHPDIDAAQAQAMLAKMNTSAKMLARELGHLIAQAEAEQYADELTDKVGSLLATMRDGKPG